MADFECRVCHAYATGFHFSAQSCQACCAFFRRAIALNRRYLCHRRQANGGGAACAIKYTEKVLCRACRLEKCLAIGMDKNAVQMPKEHSASSSSPSLGRAYFTVSGLRRNKRFANGALGLIELRNGAHSPPASAADDQTFLSSATTSATSSSHSSSTFTHNVSSSSACAEYPPPLPQQSQQFLLHNSSADLPPPSHQQIIFCPPPKLISPPKQPKWDLFGLLIAEEMRIAERRRILFCEKPVASLLGMTKTCAKFSHSPGKTFARCAFKSSDFRRSIRTHILLVYEWLRVWPGYGMLGIADQTTLLRKCVLYHTILDPCFLTIQIGDSTKFVLPNGGYVSTEKDEGWEDEAEISRDTKMSIYWPFLLIILRNVIDPMHSMRLEFDEFVALKAIVSLQMTLSDISPVGRSLISAEISSLCRSLHNYYGTKFKNPMDCAERFGNLLLLLSPIFETANTFVESHHIVQFFDLWQMDSLMLQFLKNKS